MPSIRKLAPAEVQAIETKAKGARKLTEELYDQVIAEFAAGEYGEIVPDPGENRLTARNRLTAAAKRRNVKLTFLRTRGEAMRFKIDDDGDLIKSEAVINIPEPQPEAAPVSSDAPPKRRGGRPKKNAS